MCWAHTVVCIVMKISTGWGGFGGGGGGYTQDNLEIKKVSILKVMCYNVWNRIFAENAPKILKKFRQNMDVQWCKCCQIESKTQFMYSFHGSMVERPHTIRGGGRVFIPRQIQV